MHRRVVTAAAAAAAFFVAGTPALAQPETADAFGVWRNPKDNVRVEIRPCGAAACGTVIWASPKAQAKAREAGTANLVGTQVLKNLELDERRGVWRGKVFVPELNRNFTGIAEPVDDKRLRAKGCVIGGLLCKSQIWTKIT
ncbi:DUF2147 domain-containing protein [Phenylobacterium sp.]|uniref:DUF2147 domain-containing protein n=1 Tax=Phenylobacterium sp. TaxID=1871053 RepID=UPI00281201D0|nr:DUF2147 domain-containing protein [Phenylobacterium sp.]